MCVFFKYYDVECIYIERRLDFRLSPIMKNVNGVTNKSQHEKRLTPTFKLPKYLSVHDLKDSIL